MEKQKTKRMTREERRAQIIGSALNIFIEKGYNGATTVDIANEAGISEVTLFRYFSSKKELFMEGIEPILITSLEESITASRDLEPMEKLKYILQDRITFISNNHRVIKLILMENEINPEIADFNYIDRITSLLKKSIREAGLELRDDDSSIRLLMGSILSFLYLPELDGDKIEKYISKLIGMIVE